MAFGSILKDVAEAFTAFTSPLFNAISANRADVRSKRSLHESMDFERSERIAQQDWNYQMWQQQNAYNSPAAQIQRAREAGINPNSLISNGFDGGLASNLSSGNGASITQPAAPVSPFGTDFTNGLLATAQLKDLRASANLKDKQAGLTESQDELTQQRINNAVEEMHLTKNQADQIAKLTPELVGKTRAEIDQIFAAITELRTRSSLQESQQGLVEAQTDVANAQTANIEADTEQTRAETRGINFQNDVRELESTLAKNGIILSSDWLTTLIGIMGSSNGDKVISLFFDNLKKGWSTFFPSDKKTSVDDRLEQYLQSEKFQQLMQRLYSSGMTKAAGSH